MPKLYWSKIIRLFMTQFSVSCVESSKTLSIKIPLSRKKTLIFISATCSANALQRNFCNTTLIATSNFLPFIRWQHWSPRKCTAIDFLLRIHNLAFWAFLSNGGSQGRDSNLNNETVRAIEARDEDVDYVLFVLLRRTSKPRSLLLPLTATAPLRRLISRPSVSRKL